MGWLDSIGNAINDAVDAVQDVANDVVDGVQDAVEGVGDAVQGLGNGAVDLAQDGLGTVAGGLDGLFGTDLFSDALDPLNDIVDGAQLVANTAFDAVQYGLDLAVDIPQDVGNVLVDATQTVYTIPILAAEFGSEFLFGGDGIGTELPGHEAGRFI